MNEYTNSTNADPSRSRSGLVYALLGAVVMTVFSWIPFAPVVGGALSGYLEVSERTATGTASGRGVRVGALAGLLATIPAVLVLALVGSILTVGWFGMSMSGGVGPRVSLGLPVFAWGFVLFVLVFALVYHVGLSAVGGWLGAEFAVRDAAPSRRTAATDAARDADARPDAETGLDHETQMRDDDAETPDSAAEPPDSAGETPDDATDDMESEDGSDHRSDR
jgi:hypothetical protein